MGSFRLIVSLIAGTLVSILLSSLLSVLPLSGFLREFLNNVGAHIVGAVLGIIVALMLNSAVSVRDWLAKRVLLVSFALGCGVSTVIAITAHKLSTGLLVADGFAATMLLWFCGSVLVRRMDEVADDQRAVATAKRGRDIEGLAGGDADSTLGLLGLDVAGRGCSGLFFAMIVLFALPTLALAAGILATASARSFYGLNGSESVLCGLIFGLGALGLASYSSIAGRALSSKIPLSAKDFRILPLRET